MPHANLTQVSLCDVPVNQVCTLVKMGSLGRTNGSTFESNRYPSRCHYPSCRTNHLRSCRSRIKMIPRLAIGTEIAKELKVVLGERNAS